MYYQIIAATVKYSEKYEKLYMLQNNIRAWLVSVTFYK